MAMGMKADAATPAVGGPQAEQGNGLDAKAMSGPSQQETAALNQKASGNLGIGAGDQHAGQGVSKLGLNEGMPQVQTPSTVPSGGATAFGRTSNPAGMGQEGVEVGKDAPQAGQTISKTQEHGQKHANSNEHGHDHEHAHDHSQKRQQGREVKPEEEHKPAQEKSETNKPTQEKSGVNKTLDTALDFAKEHATALVLTAAVTAAAAYLIGPKAAIAAAAIGAAVMGYNHLKSRKKGGEEAASSGKDAELGAPEGNKSAAMSKDAPTAPAQTPAPDPTFGRSR